MGDDQTVAEVRRRFEVFIAPYRAGIGALHELQHGGAVCLVEPMPGGDIFKWAAAEIAALRARPPSLLGAQGYADAFYELAAMLDLGADARSPAVVWRDVMRPRLQAVLGGLSTTEGYAR